MNELHFDDTSSLGEVPWLEPREVHEQLEPLTADLVDELPPRTALLMTVGGPVVGSRFVLDGSLGVGRDRENAVQLVHPTVSRRHAAFRRDGDRFTVADMFSLNGVYVNGAKVDGRRLGHGDKIQIGPYVLLFLTSPNTESAHGRPG